MRLVSVRLWWGLQGAARDRSAQWFRTRLGQLQNVGGFSTVSSLPKCSTLKPPNAARAQQHSSLQKQTPKVSRATGIATCPDPEVGIAPALALPRCTWCLASLEASRPIRFPAGDASYGRCMPSRAPDPQGRCCSRRRRHPAPLPLRQTLVQVLR